jgi:SNF2 family DNA or RNA helicase
MKELLLSIGLPAETAHQFSRVELPFQLMPHQVKALQGLLHYNRFGLFLPARTGKSIVMQIAAIYFANYGFRTMIAMPPALFDQFRNDFDRIKGHGLNVHVFEHSPVKRKNLIAQWDEVDGSVPDVRLLSREIFKAHWNELYRLRFKNVFFDESHMGLQSTKSQTYKMMRRHADQNPSNRLVLSTGTPIPNQIENAFGTISLVNPFSYKSERHFKLQHCVYKEIFVSRGGRRDTVYVIDKYVNHAELKRNLYRQAITVSKLKVLNLQAPNVQVVDTHLSRKHRALYERVLKDRLLETPSEGLIDARQAQKLRMVALQLISSPEAYDESIKPGDNSIYGLTQALLDSINVDQNKVLLFANFTRTVEGLAEHFKKYQPAVVYGPNGPQKNRAQVEHFRNSPNSRILIANPVAGGVGFTLGDVCTNVVFVEPVSSPGAFDQALSRTLLVGQKEPVVVYILRVVDTISPDAIEAMQGKVEDLEKVQQDRNSLFSSLIGKAKR